MGDCTCGLPCFDPELGPFHHDDPNCPVHGDDREDDDDE